MTSISTRTIKTMIFKIAMVVKDVDWMRHMFSLLRTLQVILLKNRVAIGLSTLPPWALGTIDDKRQDGPCQGT